MAAANRDLNGATPARGHSGKQVRIGGGWWEIVRRWVAEADLATFQGTVDVDVASTMSSGTTPTFMNISRSKYLPPVMAHNKSGTKMCPQRDDLSPRFVA